MLKGDGWAKTEKNLQACMHMIMDSFLVLVSAVLLVSCINSCASHGGDLVVLTTADRLREEIRSQLCYDSWLYSQSSCYILQGDTGAGPRLSLRTLLDQRNRQ